LAGLQNLPSGLAAATADVQEVLLGRVRAKAALGQVLAASKDLEAVQAVQEELRVTIKDHHNPKFSKGSGMVPDPRLWAAMAKSKIVAAELKLQITDTTPGISALSLASGRQDALKFAWEALNLLLEVQKSGCDVPRGPGLATLAQARALVNRAASYEGREFGEVAESDSDDANSRDNDISSEPDDEGVDGIDWNDAVKNDDDDVAEWSEDDDDDVGLNLLQSGADLVVADSGVQHDYIESMQASDMDQTSDEGQASDMDQTLEDSQTMSHTGGSFPQLSDETGSNERADESVSQLSDETASNERAEESLSQLSDEMLSSEHAGESSPQLSDMQGSNELADSIRKMAKLLGAGQTDVPAIHAETLKQGLAAEQAVDFEQMVAATTTLEIVQVGQEQPAGEQVEMVAATTTPEIVGLGQEQAAGEVVA